MLDAGALRLGAPRVSVTALTDLHQLLVKCGFQASSPDDSHIVQLAWLETDVLAARPFTETRSMNGAGAVRRAGMS